MCREHTLRAAHRATCGVVSMYSLPLLTLKRIWSFTRRHSRQTWDTYGEWAGNSKVGRGCQGLAGAVLW